MSKGQAYSLLTMLSCQGSIDRVMEHVKQNFPEHVEDSQKFFTLYDHYRNKKEFPNYLYVDAQAFKRAWSEIGGMNV